MTLVEHHAHLKDEGKWDEYQAVLASKEEQRKQLLEARNRAAQSIVKGCWRES
ncbi:MAG TPA: hypothetical protein VIT90_01185 [Lysobacter sp.]